MNIHQTPENPLSPTGQKQARAIAGRIKNIKGLDFILSSNLNRAEQTAQIISEATGLPVTLTGLAVERKLPTEVIGTPWHGEVMTSLKKIMEEHKDDPSWHYSDEENFYDQRNRAQKLLIEIEEYGEKNILLVSHGHFIRLIVGLMMFGNEITPDEFDKLEKFMNTINTGITICERKDDRWKLWTWNDHAHLG